MFDANHLLHRISPTFCTHAVNATDSHWDHSICWLCVADQLQEAHTLGRDRTERECIKAMCELFCGKGEMPTRGEYEGWHHGHRGTNYLCVCEAEPIYERIYQRNEEASRGE